MTPLELLIYCLVAYITLLIVLLPLVVFEPKMGRLLARRWSVAIGCLIYMASFAIVYVLYPAVPYITVSFGVASTLAVGLAVATLKAVSKSRSK